MIRPQDSYLEQGVRHRPRSRLSPPTPPSRLDTLRGALRRNLDLLRNAGSLAGTTGVTSALGFAFWTYAARVFSTEAVGYGSAAISTMVLLGTLGMFGLDTMLIGELPRGGNRRGGLIMASCIVAFVVSLALGFAWAVISLSFGARFVELNGTPGRMALFSFGVAVTGAAFVFDAATIGLMRGGLQLSRNTAVSVAKMAALPASALILHDMFGVGIELAWVIGTVVSLVPIAIMIKRSGSRIIYRPDFANLWHLRKLALAHNWLNLAINIPDRMGGVLVAIVVSPSSNGAYYIATMVTQFLFMVPASLSTVLFAVASAAPEKIAEKLRFVLRTAILIGIPAGLALGLGSHFILSLFGSSYVSLAAGPLWLLIAAYIPGLPNTTYIAVARAQGRFNQAAIFLTAFGALRMVALVVGGKIDDLYGLSYAVLAVVAVQACITTPSVLRTAFGSAAVRPQADYVGAGEARRHPAERGEEMRLRQEAGLAALIALATQVAAYPAGPDTGALGVDPATWLAPATRQWAVGSPGRHPRHRAVAATAANKAVTDTDWWPDSSAETFRSRQEEGIAALIAIATQGARY